MKLVWAESAQRDFDEALTSLSAKSPRGAERIGARILRVIALLERFPELAPPSRHRGLRQLIVSRTPYLVVYRVTTDAVEIRAIIHAMQKRRK